MIYSGAWEDVLSDVRADVLISDPPYSSRTHKGHDSGADQSNRKATDRAPRNTISYKPWGRSDVEKFVAHWSKAVRGWIVILTDHVLFPVFEECLLRAGRYVFAPIPFIAVGSRVRLLGDGPSSWTTWIIVARPRCEPWSKWGTLPGAYILPKGYNDLAHLSHGAKFPGAKTLWLMQALVRDYSKRGDTIVDPCAGTGTTLLAAEIEGRKGIGSEENPKTFEHAKQRLDRAFTPSFDFGEGT